jgi:hypothetical protein
MSVFDQITPGARLRGLDGHGVADVVSVSRFGPNAVNFVFRVNGRVLERLLYRGEDADLQLVEGGRTWGFDADPALLRLASEAYRIRLAHLFDPYLAVTASDIEALPMANVIGAQWNERSRDPLILPGRVPIAHERVRASVLIRSMRASGRWSTARWMGTARCRAGWRRIPRAGSRRSAPPRAWPER